MNEKINALNAAKKKIQAVSLVFVVCGILCVLLLMRRPMASGILLAAMLLFYIFCFRRLVKRYRQKERQAMLEEGLRSCLKEITYQEKDGISKDALQQTHFLPAEVPSNILIRETVTGTYQGMPAVMTDITTAYRIYPGTKEKRMGFLSGCYFEIRLSRCQWQRFQLWPKEMLPEQARSHYLPGLTESPAPGKLKDSFCLYISQDVLEPPLSEDTIKAILRLAEYTPGRLVLQASGSCLQIFIQNRFLCTQELPAKEDITAQMLSVNPFPEAPYLLRVADAMNTSA